jgi:hypothetical protein
VENIKILIDPETVIATVVPPRIEEEIAPAVEEGPAEPEVIGKGPEEKETE